jgi:hypothetical protein
MTWLPSFAEGEKSTAALEHFVYQQVIQAINAMD